MGARDIYGRYRHRLSELAQNSPASPDWPERLEEIVAAFRLEIVPLDTASSALLCEELCEQLEFSAHAATNDVARRVWRAALKKIELIS